MSATPIVRTDELNKRGYARIAPVSARAPKTASAAAAARDNVMNSRPVYQIEPK